jgi:hypothetical protein
VYSLKRTFHRCFLPNFSSFGWGFSEEKIKMWKVNGWQTNQKQELPVVAMFVNGSGQNVQSWERTFYRCFLPSFSSFGWGVSEEKIKMWKVNGRQTTDSKWWQKLLLPLARWAKKSFIQIIAYGTAIETTCLERPHFADRTDGFL